MDAEKLEQFNAFVQSIPAKHVENPYWRFDETNKQIINRYKGDDEAFDVDGWRKILRQVKSYFISVYDSFQSEAQVLCVDAQDELKLENKAIPRLPGIHVVDGKKIAIFVLPQYNSFGITTLSEQFWQSNIINKGIHPVARIHSHHILDPYQSATDYASLNSNTLELVIGNIYDERLHVGYWLDVRGTNVKDNVWVAEEQENGQFTTSMIPCGKVRESQIKKYQTERGNE